MNILINMKGRFIAGFVIYCIGFTQVCLIKLHASIKYVKCIILCFQQDPQGLENSGNECAKI